MDMGSPYVPSRLSPDIATRRVPRQTAVDMPPRRRSERVTQRVGVSASRHPRMVYGVLVVYIEAQMLLHRLRGEAGRSRQKAKPRDDMKGTRNGGAE